MTEVVLSTFTVSWRTGGHGSDQGRQTVFVTPRNFFFVEIPTKKNLVMITQFLKKCTTTVIGNEIKMPCIGFEIVQTTRSRIAILANTVTCDHRAQSCASRLHLQSYFSKQRSNTVRKTLNRHDQRQKSHSKAIGNRSSSNSSSSRFVMTCRLAQGNMCTTGLGTRHVRGNTTDDQTSTRKLVQGKLCRETCAGEAVWVKRRQSLHNG